MASGFNPTQPGSRPCTLSALVLSAFSAVAIVVGVGGLDLTLPFGQWGHHSALTSEGVHSENHVGADCHCCPGREGWGLMRRGDCCCHRVGVAGGVVRCSPSAVTRSRVHFASVVGVQLPSAGSLQASTSPFRGLPRPPALLHPGGAVLCSMFSSFLTPVIN